MNILSFAQPKVETSEFEISTLNEAMEKSTNLLLSHQFLEGFWWYTLEANESIGAEFIFLLHYLKIHENYSSIEHKLVARMLSEQLPDGSWTLYFGGPGDLSTTLECYVALKMSGLETDSLPLKKARHFILNHGGLHQARVFTKIHLAMFGLIDWDEAPAMPISFILLPEWFPITIYEFSSWARSCIVPLLLLLNKRKVVKIENISIEELIITNQNEKCFNEKKLNPISWSNFFIQLDKTIKFIKKYYKNNRLDKKSQDKACNWIIQHTKKTEDIYPALAYSVMALDALGYSFNSPEIQKCFQGLLSFHQNQVGELPALPSFSHSLKNSPAQATFSTPFLKIDFENATALHQQCCVSPVWDTPWVLSALLESGISPEHPALIKAGRWLISKQITETYGDWSIKNGKAFPGGWSFEFQNDYFPDVDDTIQILSVLNQLKLPTHEKDEPVRRGLAWMLSMQSKNGGWAAFDVNNTLKIVNKIPFSDHGACLDPPTPDITGRALELLGKMGYPLSSPACTKAIRFLEKTQEKNGSWWGRWGVNYLYGTWCVLQGLVEIGIPQESSLIQNAVSWLKSVQNEDGGWSESCESYLRSTHIPLPYSVPSQTAWALMGMIAGGKGNSDTVKRGVDFLMRTQTPEGSWNEQAYTGTGFPGHFYIRYHGYRHYFPTLALARYYQNISC